MDSSQVLGAIGSSVKMDATFNVHIKNVVFLTPHSSSQSQLSSGLRLFACSNAGVVGSNPTQSMDVLCLFCVQIAALRWADPPSDESYRLCIGLRNLNGSQRPIKGCRAIERERERDFKF
jgi:hypothetical protein